MASLKVVSDRLDDNALKVAVVIPPRRDGTANLACLASLVSAIHVINPDAFDPAEKAAELAHLDGHSADGGGIVPHEIAAARMRDLPDDDEGEPIPGFRCANGACIGD